MSTGKHHSGFKACNTKKDQDNKHNSLSSSHRLNDRKKNHDDECGTHRCGFRTCNTQKNQEYELHLSSWSSKLNNRKKPQ